MLPSDRTARRLDRARPACAVRSSEAGILGDFVPVCQARGAGIPAPAYACPI